MPDIRGTGLCLFDVRRVMGETVDGPPEEQTIN